MWWQTSGRTSINERIFRNDNITAWVVNVFVYSKFPRRHLPRTTINRDRELDRYRYYMNCNVGNIVCVHFYTDQIINCWQRSGQLYWIKNRIIVFYVRLVNTLSRPVESFSKTSSPFSTFSSKTFGRSPCSLRFKYVVFTLKINPHCNTSFK